MDLDTLVQHYFGSDDPASLNETDYERAIERLRIDFGVEREPGRRFALWCLMDAIGVAPLPAEAFAKEPQLKAAAEDYLSAVFRMEREGDEE
ncbi:MAG: hypothetical protein ACKOQM_13255 [Novosphingobium sp.]|jgi:hypothetical protein